MTGLPVPHWTKHRRASNIIVDDPDGWSMSGAPGPKVPRHLAAIFAADVEGYSRLMEVDEVGTLRTLTSHQEIMDRLIGEHGGRIANTAGDSVLAEFPSIIEAVQAAVEIQEALKTANDALSEDRRVRFRIGVHIGDVMVKEGDLFGEGVNIAARLQALAESGGVCISSPAHEYVRKALPLSYQDLGFHQVKNIAEPVRAFAVRAGGGGVHPAAQPASGSSRSLPLPDKPSIAVLPFVDLSADAERDYFADGVVEDIISALSHFRGLFVIARNSSFTYKGRAVDVRQVGQELGVRYVLEGSIRRAGDRIRLTGQLIDAQSGTHLWAERFDGSMQDIFDLQDEMASRVVGAIVPRMQLAEIERAKRSRPENLDAYDLYLRALAAVREMTLTHSDQALSFVRRALEISPDYAIAAGLGAWAYTLRMALQWPVDRSLETQLGLELARLALQRGQDDSEALAAGGYSVAHLGGELAEGLRAIERAISLNPNNALAFGHAAFVHIFSGRPRNAIECVNQSMRLSPRDPMLYRAHAARAYAHLLLEEFDEAISWGLRAIEENPSYTVTYRALAVAYAYSGRMDEARDMVDRIRRLTPGITMRGLPEWVVFRQSGRLEFILDGLRKAGLPE